MKKFKEARFSKVSKLGFLLVVCTVGRLQQLKAQDIIYKVKGDSIVSAVEEVTDDNVLYFKVPTSKTDVRKSISTKEVRKIKYANGYVELFESTAATATSAAVAPAAVAYDIMYTVSGSQLKGQVLEVDDTSVTYRLLGSASVDKIATDRLIGIRYSNGFEEAYNAPAAVKQQLASQAQSTAAPAGPAPGLDVIKLDNGKEIRAHIDEVDEVNIYYTEAGAPGAKRETLALDKVIKVQYANGYEETYAVIKTFKTKDKEEGEDKTPPKATAAKTAPPKKAPVKKEPGENPLKVAKQSLFKTREPNKKTPAPEKVVAPLAAQTLAVLDLADVLKKEIYASLPAALAEPTKVEYLDLRGTGLKALPAEVSGFKNLVAINLSKNNLRKFPMELLNLPNLQYVWLDETGLQSLAFEGEQLEKLKQSHIVFLSAKSNRLTKVSSSVFTLANLQELKLSGNQISGIAFDKKSDLSQSYLQSIDFQNNKFSSLPTELKDLPSLTHLNFGGNNIKALDKETAGFTALKSLKLNSNPLKKINPQFYKMTAIEEVDLNQTQLTSLPDSISKLTKLKILVLPGTFANFPADFGQLKLLTELRLNNSTPYSKINKFPEVLLSCQRLRTLDLSGAAIQTLPADIAKLRRLENLYLSNCGLTSLPEELFTLPRLKVLDLSNNKITQISASVAELGSLENLNLKDSPVNGASLMSLRRALPSAQIEYYDSDFGLNFTSAPLPARLLPGFRRLSAACDKGDPAAYYELGAFFASSNDYGLAVKAYRVITDNPQLEGTGKSVACLLSIAEIYDDVHNVKPYTSPYKNKRYTDYDDYLNTSANNKAYLSYLAISRISVRDAVAQQAQKKACARASLICNEIAQNLERIFERNNQEIERLIKSSGDMQSLSAGGDKIFNDAAVNNDGTSAAIGGMLSILGSVASSAKEDKSAKYKSQNERLKADISHLRAQATELAAR
ncbi:MAG: leucine-rich repeat domain-containing protein [Janthinobacterium lividum]